MKLLRFIAVLVPLAFPVGAWAQKTSADVVKVTVEADKVDSEGRQNVRIVLQIDKAFHLYANPVKNEMLESSQVTLKFPKAEDVKIEYPEGKSVKDNVVGDYRSYEGKVVIKASFKRGKADGPTAFTLKLSACDDKICLAPATIKKSIP